MNGENISHSELDSIRSSLEAISSRLERLEGQRSEPTAHHPSSHKFAIAEAIVDGLFAAEKDKACTFEPNGKPCDHCSMCSSRGF